MSDEITIKKETLWKYSTFILAAFLIVGAVLFFTEEKTTGNVVKNNPIPSAAAAAVDVDDDAVLGDKDAPVTIIEFSDYECPFCAKFWSQTLPSIKSEYIDTGKVKIVFRDYPLGFHQNAQKSAEAVECVREKGGDKAYWEMHDLIFKNQPSLSEANLKVWAKSLGYDIEDCLQKGTYTKEVQKDFADGSAAGVRGTPAFFVNGKLLSGAQPFSAFKQAIDAEL